MSDAPSSAAGGRPPAVSLRADWVEWRERRDRPVYEARLWPHRSMGRKGRTVFLAITALGLMVPLFPALGTPVFWGLAPFLAAAMLLIWYGFRRNLRDLHLTETVAVWPDEIRVERVEPDGLVRRWSAEPFKVRLTLHPEAKVEQYLTMKGAGREIELGAFLAPEERVALAGEIEAALTRAIRG